MEERASGPATIFYVVDVVLIAYCNLDWYRDHNRKADQLMCRGQCFNLENMSKICTCKVLSIPYLKYVSAFHNSDHASYKQSGRR